MSSRRSLQQVTWALGVTACGVTPTTRTDEAEPSPAPVLPSEDGGASAGPVAPGGSEPNTTSPPPAVTPPGTVLDPEPDVIVLEPEPVSVSASEQCSEALVGTEATRELMEPFVVDHDAFARRTLYSWTVPEQIEELREDPTLLSRSMTSDGERGKAADLILERSETDEVAALLAESRFEKRRFGWTNPWATVLGFTGEGYGDRLLAITLREEAIVGRMVAARDGTMEWTFQTLDGATVDRETLFANSERLAAIYFVDERDPANCRGSVTNSGSVMREFFVLNEAMVERFSAFTPELRAEVARGVEALGALEAALSLRACSDLEDPGLLGPTCWRERVLQVWADPEQASSTLLGLYEASLAFPADLYLPVRDNLRRLIETLEQVPFDEQPLVHVAAP